MSGWRLETLLDSFRLLCLSYSFCGCLSLQKRPEPSLKAFAEEAYYKSREYGIYDVRTSIAFYNLSKVFYQTVHGFFPPTVILSQFLSWEIYTEICRTSSPLNIMFQAFCWYEFFCHAPCWPGAVLGGAGTKVTLYSLLGLSNRCMDECPERGGASHTCWENDGLGQTSTSRFQGCASGFSTCHCKVAHWWSVWDVAGIILCSLTSSSIYLYASDFHLHFLDQTK